MEARTAGRDPVTGERRGVFSRLDAVTWLTLYIVFLFGVPSRLVVGPLGSAGALSMLLGLASMGIWLLLRVGATSRPFGPRPEPLGVALGVFLFSVGVSYALAMSKPINGDEVSPADVAILSLLSWTGTLLIARDGIRLRERLDTFVWRLAVAGGLLGALGVVQFVTRLPIIDWMRWCHWRACGGSPWSTTSASTIETAESVLPAPPFIRSNTEPFSASCFR